MLLEFSIIIFRKEQFLKFRGMDTFLLLPQMSVQMKPAYTRNRGPRTPNSNCLLYTLFTDLFHKLHLFLFIEGF